MSKRYCLVSDNDGHHFVIPCDRIVDFEAWLEQVERDGDAETPFYAFALGGSPTNLSFEFPLYKGQPLT